MELVPDARLRSALHLVVALSEAGSPDVLPTADDVDAYADDCEKGAYSSAFGSGGLIGHIRLVMGPPRRPSQRLIELGWAFTISDGESMASTPLGQSVHQAMLTEQRAAEDQEISEIRLGADREVAWETLIESLRNFDEYLLIDPYLERKQLQLLMRDTALTQAMTSFKEDRGGRQRRQEIVDLIARASQFGNGTVQFEVREAEVGRLHDRFVIVGDEVWTLGASLNGLGKYPTLLVRLGSTANEVKSDNLRLWGEAETLSIEEHSMTDDLQS